MYDLSYTFLLFKIFISLFKCRVTEIWRDVARGGGLGGNLPSRSSLSGCASKVSARGTSADLASFVFPTACPQLPAPAQARGYIDGEQGQKWNAWTEIGVCVGCRCLHGLTHNTLSLPSFRSLFFYLSPYRFFLDLFYFLNDKLTGKE